MKQGVGAEYHQNPVETIRIGYDLLATGFASWLREFCAAQNPPGQSSTPLSKVSAVA